MSEPSTTTPTGIHHVRLTVTDVRRSKAFYTELLGSAPAMDFTDQADDPEARQDPERLFAGCIFAVGDQLLGLRPGAASGDRFEPTRVGLDHVSLTVDSPEELAAAAQRLTTAGVEHGEVRDLGPAGMAVLSLQDPDDINLELNALTA
ncbi:VOC family protein [Angustibacter aerolatus]